MNLTRRQIAMLRDAIAQAIKAYDRLGWVRVHTFTDEKGKYVSVMSEDTQRRRACNIMGALMIGFEQTKIRMPPYQLDLIKEYVQSCLPKEFHRPDGIYAWNDTVCKSRKECVAFLKQTLARLEKL